MPEGKLSLVERLQQQLRPFSDAELAAAGEPHPHAFQQDDMGIAPVGEVTVIAAPGREGKTFVTIALSVSYVLGTRVVGLTPMADRSVIIYSAEDDRRQYARKVYAHTARLGNADAQTVRDRLIVPDLSAPQMEPFTALVRPIERQPVATTAVDIVIDTLHERMAEPNPPGLLIFETASTLSEAEEDNAAFRVMVKALRRIARELNVAVVLVHHTSQAAANNLPDLSVGVGDIRGGTALAFNARQCFLLVNLGSDEDPFPDADARTVLRQMAAPNASGRVAVLVCLDSSKAIDPPPVFFHWDYTPYGPALSAVAVPSSLEGARWRKLRQMMQGERAERRQSAKDEARDGATKQVVRIVRDMVGKGAQPTVRAVSVAANRSATWAKPYLEGAVESGELRAAKERVPRVSDPVIVYRPSHSTGGVE